MSVSVQQLGHLVVDRLEHVVVRSARGEEACSTRIIKNMEELKLDHSQLDQLKMLDPTMEGVQDISSENDEENEGVNDCENDGENEYVNLDETLEELEFHEKQFDKTKKKKKSTF